MNQRQKYAQDDKCHIYHGPRLVNVLEGLKEKCLGRLFHPGLVDAQMLKCFGGIPILTVPIPLWNWYMTY